MHKEYVLLEDGISTKADLWLILKQSMSALVMLSSLLKLFFLHFTGWWYSGYNRWCQLASIYGAPEETGCNSIVLMRNTYQPSLSYCWSAREIIISHYLIYCYILFYFALIDKLLVIILGQWTTLNLLHDGRFSATYRDDFAIKRSINILLCFRKQFTGNSEMSVLYFYQFI